MQFAHEETLRLRRVSQLLADELVHVFDVGTHGLFAFSNGLRRIKNRHKVQEATKKCVTALWQLLENSVQCGGDRLDFLFRMQMHETVQKHPE